MDAQIETSSGSDYRLGTVIAVFLMIVGAWDAVLCSVVSIGAVAGLRVAGSPANRLFIAGGLLYSAVQLVTGFALLRRGKAGLWGLYVLGLPIVVLAAYAFVEMVRFRTGGDEFIASVLALGFWFAIVRYFWIRRAQSNAVWSATVQS